MRLADMAELLDDQPLREEAELMDKLAQTIPVGVTLATVRQQGASLNLEGTSLTDRTSPEVLDNRTR